MRRIFLLLMLVTAVSVYGQRWEKTIVPGDKVEQTSPTEAWLYYDENVLLVIMPYGDAFSIAPINDNVALVKTYERGVTLSGTTCTIAAFDNKQQRTGYWTNVLLIASETDRGLIGSDKLQVYEENKNCTYELFKHLKNNSGSMVFRLTSDKGDLLDYEIRTIKTLGYDDKNGRHWDGDIDVIGVR